MATNNMLLVLEIKNALENRSYAGLATIVSETNAPSAKKAWFIRFLADLAIVNGKQVQAQHLVEIRFPRIMTPMIRRRYRAMLACG
jgi:hypothetical protein